MTPKLIPSLAAVVLLATGTLAGTALAQTDAAPVAEQVGDVAWDTLDRPTAPQASAELVVAGVPAMFVPVTPYRSIDSRDYQAGRRYSLNGPKANPLPLDVTLDEFGDQAIPLEAVAITFNLTVVNQTSSGHVSVSSIDLSPRDALATSTVNWSGPGGPIANASTVTVNDFEGEPGYVAIIVGGLPDASTDFIIDVTGYYIAA